MTKVAVVRFDFELDILKITEIKIFLDFYEKNGGLVMGAVDK